MTSLPRILLVSHALGGGVEGHLADLRMLLASRAHTEVLRPVSPEAVSLEYSDQSTHHWRCDDWSGVVAALASRAYSRIHFHHVHGLPPDILGLAQSLGLPYDVTLHDYMAFCPQYQLSTPEGGYCGEPDASACQSCVDRRPHAWGWSIARWRSTMGGFLAQAERVVAPTTHVQRRVATHFPDIPVIVKAHPPRADWLQGPTRHVKVVLIGALSRIKGLTTLIDTVRMARQRAIPLSFVLLGFPEHAIDPGLPVQIRGQYKDAELPHLLALERPDVLWFPGQFPETHAYTLDVALCSGLPVVASDRGALKERLAEGQRACLVNASASTEDWVNALLAAGGLSQVMQPAFTTWPDAQASRAQRQSYGDFILQGLTPTDQAWPVPAATDLSALAVALTPARDMPLTALFEHGVLCGKAEPRQALQRKLVEIERDYTVLDGYSQRFGRPWYSVLEDTETIRRQTHDGQQQLAQLRVTVRDREQALDLALQEATDLRARMAEMDLNRVHEESEKFRQHTERLAQVERQVEARGEELVRAVGQLRKMEDSTSWKVTAPMRSIGNALKGLRHQAARSSSLAAQGIRRLPLMWDIARTQGLTVLAQRIAVKLKGQRFEPAVIEAPVISPIQPLKLATCPLGTVPRISLVIPVYGQHVHTFNCLKSLGEHTDLHDVEIIVVDDASPEPAAAALAGVEGIELVRNPQNLGFIGSCNRGGSLARGDYLILLNNDIQVTPGWLEALLDVFRLRADTGMVGARLVYPDGRLQEAGGIVWQDASAWNWGRNGDPERPEYSYLRAADYCSGACLALRRSDWLAWEGFDRAYVPAYYEDTDLAFRVRAAGKKVYYQPQAKIIHFEGVSSGTDVTQGVKRHQVINHKVFRERWQQVLLAHRPNGEHPLLEVDRGARSRVLVVEACMITPDQDSGSVRMQAMLELLVELGCKVSFVADNLECRQPYARMLQQMGVEVWHHPYIHSVAQLLEERGSLYDVILFCRHYIATPYVARIREWAPRARIVFDTVDLHYLREQRKAELDQSPALMATAHKTRDQELAVIRQSDITLVVSPVEQALLAQDAPEAQVRILSNIHEPRRASTTYAEREGLLFIGGFRHPPNIDAMEWFVTHVWPLVRAQLPGVSLTIVGSHMPESIKGLAGNGISTPGFVEDVHPLIDAARISLAPLRYGAGVKGKINQAMACGLPVVATSVAAEGMSLAAGEELLVADAPQDFANEIVRLYNHPALWESIAERGYDNVRRHFSRATAKEALAALL